MLKFLKYFVLLALTVFIADRVIYYGIRSIQNKTYRGIQGGKINDYLRQQVTPSLVIMGPSSPANQLDPDSFTVNTFNLGHPDTEDAFQDALLSVITGNNKIPRNILLYINPYAYTGADSKAPFVSRSPLKLGYYYSRDPLVTDYIREIGLNERIKFMMQLTKYNNRVFSICKDYLSVSGNKNYHKGFFPFVASARDSMTVVADYERSKAQLRQEQTTQSSKMRYLTDFVKTCRTRNINLILFTLPEYEDVVTNFTADTATQNVIDYCKLNNLPYFDFRQGELPRLISKPAFWKDIQHLNELGAGIESAFVSAKIKSLLR